MRGGRRQHAGGGDNPEENMRQAKAHRSPRMATAADTTLVRSLAPPSTPGLAVNVVDRVASQQGIMVAHPEGSLRHIVLGPRIT